MIILGLAGQPGCGKSTIADYLVEKYGFLKFAFSDAIYDEIQRAFGLQNQTLLRDRALKEQPSYALQLANCNDEDFAEIASALVRVSESAEFLPAFNRALSPRQVLQWWGTEYRRAQDPDYWIIKAMRTISSYRRAAPYPEMTPDRWVEAGTRFENERRWIKAAWGAKAGNIWHVYRGKSAVASDHVSDTRLPVIAGERELWNNADIEQLQAGIDLLMSHPIKFVRCEPLLPNGQFYSRQPDGHIMLCNVDGTRSIFDDVDE